MHQYAENYAFIDSQNVNLSIREIGWQLDFRKFRVYLRDKFRVTKAYLFIGYVPGNEKLYLRLQTFGYVVVFKPTLGRKGEIKGNCDADLVLRCVLDSMKYDKAVIVSGDGDFYCLIEYLLTQNKLLKIGIPDEQKYSSLLKRFKPHFFYISMLKELLQYKKG
jgi:uncharacterized LabA/DUF88 family protein